MRIMAEQATSLTISNRGARSACGQCSPPPPLAAAGHLVMAMTDYSKHDTSVESALKVCLALFGEPTSRSQSEVRWGTNGSKKLILTGDYAGQFSDFENDRKGNYISVVKWYGSGQPIWQQLDDIGVARLDVVGGRYKDLPMRNGRPVSKKTQYVYADSDGEVQYTVTRYDFADGPGKTFQHDRGKKAKLLYNWLQMINEPEKPVWIVEGEKNVEALRELGELAVTNCGGSNGWVDAFGEHFSGRDCIIVEDNDDAGRKWVEQVRASLEPYAEHLFFVEFREYERTADVSDFLVDNSRQDLHEKIKDAKSYDQSDLELEGEIDYDDIDSSITFPLISIEELFDRPPPEWLIESFIPQGELAVIFGPPAQGKTFLSLDMALHMAAGRNWHGFETKEARVLYIAGEGLSGLPGRLQAWHKHHGFEPLKNFVILPQSVSFLDRSEMNKLDLTIRELDEPFDVIFIDTVSRAMVGGDENSAETMGMFISHCEALQRAYGCTVVGVHHSGKDATKGLRGSSALLGAVTSSLSVTKVDDQVKVSSEKQKDIELPEPLQFDMVGVEYGEGLFASESVVLEMAAIAKDEKTGRRVSANEKIVLDALHDAIYQHGRYSNLQDVPGHQKVVGLEVWRKQAGEKMNMGSKAWYRTFKRAATRLIAHGFINKKEDEHWPA